MEVTRIHLGIVRRDGERAFEDLAPGVHHDDPVGDPVDEAHQVLDDEQRHAAVREARAAASPCGRVRPG